jgi:hypothetical protein
VVLNSIVLMAVATRTRESQVLQRGRAAAHRGNDVFYYERFCRHGKRGAAVLAAPASTVFDQAAKPLRNPVSQWRVA